MIVQCVCMIRETLPLLEIWNYDIKISLFCFLQETSLGLLLTDNDNLEKQELMRILIYFSEVLKTKHAVKHHL